MKFIPVIFSTMFLVFAGLQWNDPDPMTWISLYLAAAFLCYLAYRQKLSAVTALVAGALYVTGAVYLWPAHYEGIAGDMEGHPAVKTARESLGLAICAMGVIASFFIRRTGR